MNSLVTADTDELIAGQEAVLENCLQKISGEATPRDFRNLKFPTLPPLTQQ
jgi:hypothetical protein